MASDIMIQTIILELSDWHLHVRSDAHWRLISPEQAQAESAGEFIPAEDDWCAWSGSHRGAKGGRNLPWGMVYLEAPDSEAVAVRHEDGRPIELIRVEGLTIAEWRSPPSTVVITHEGSEWTVDVDGFRDYYQPQS